MRECVRVGIVRLHTWAGVCECTLAHNHFTCGDANINNKYSKNYRIVAQAVDGVIIIIIETLAHPRLLGFVP